MKNPLDWSLLYGVIPVLLTALGALSLAYLTIRPRRHWYSRIIPVVLLFSGAVVVTARWLVVDVWHPFGGPLPTTVLTWTGVTIAAVSLGVARLGSSRWRPRLLTTCAVVLVTLMALNNVNTFFGYYPNLRDALGLPPPNEISAANAAVLDGHSVATPTGESLVASWKPPRDLPKTGKVVEVDIPGNVSHFQARSAWLYLPPAYLTARRPLLPVLELIGGQPGTSRDWLDGGLSEVMDKFASQHDGLAPVVVMPDALGSFWADPLCMNSRLGQSDTYLTVDVPNWIRRHLAVDEDTRFWAVGGGSFGGTCAWQLAVLHPTLFPTFIDMSGVFQQSAGTLQQTIDAAFGGNARRFAAVNPVQILAHHTRTMTWATITAGSTDTYYLENQERTAALCRKAGMHVRWLAIPGGHTFEFFSTIVAESMTWLGHRDNIL